ncbi:hypothetical protein [Photobacterium phosphoreum]|uniref:hypothetical protein n=1 Tax=Photobacterium phosphoreum TaxID=659 RepID=UPI0024B69ACB|nr:hypothetical protein [Photobacterium phosphoreum]
MENIEIERSSVELKLTLMARSLKNKESCKLIKEPIEIINLMQSSIDYLTRRAYSRIRDKSTNIRFIVVPASDVVSSAADFEITLDDEFTGWQNDYEWLCFSGKEPVIVMVYLSDAIKLLPSFRDSQLNRCAAFFAERSSFEQACLMRIEQHKQSKQSKQTVYGYDD